MLLISITSFCGFFILFYHFSARFGSTFIVTLHIEYDLLYEAALCRERADWIVGINATRLFSCLYRQTLNVGRVMTPTLAMIVMREAAIKGFQPEPFYSVQLQVGGFKLSGERVKVKTDAEALV